MNRLFRRLGWSSVCAVTALYVSYYIIIVVGWFLVGRNTCTGYGCSAIWFSEFETPIFYTSIVLSVVVWAITFMLLKKDEIL